MNILSLHRLGIHIRIGFQQLDGHRQVIVHELFQLRHYLGVLLYPVKNLAHQRLHPGNLVGNFLAGDRIVAGADVPDKGVAPVQHLLHPCIPLLFFGIILLLLGFHGLLLALHRLLLSDFQVVDIGIIAGDETGFFLVQMAFQEHPVVNHAL